LSAQAKDTVDTAVGAGNLKTLAAALTAAGLVDTMKGPDPFTVFAPTDDAFAKIPEAHLDALLADKAKRTSVLTYRVLPGKVMAKHVKIGRGKTVRGSHTGFEFELKNVRARSGLAVSTLALLLGGCAAVTPPRDAAVAADPSSRDLACPLPSNCVSSRGNGGVEPLRYTGTPTRAVALLQATLTTFAEATVVRSEPLALNVIFTTPIGFRDEVDFRIDPEAQRIDFRSRSLFGLFDWGKNRSRMQEFRTRFEQQRLP
jgi:uncharacterized protein (DUF1499 family)